MSKSTTSVLQQADNKSVAKSCQSEKRGDRTVPWKAEEWDVCSEKRK